MLFPLLNILRQFFKTACVSKPLARQQRLIMPVAQRRNSSLRLQQGSETDFGMSSKTDHSFFAACVVFA